MLTDDMVEKGVSDSIHIYASKWYQHDHSAKAVCDCPNGVVAAALW